MFQQGLKAGLNNSDANAADPANQTSNALKGSNSQESNAHEENPMSEQEKAATSQNEAEKGFLIRLFTEKDIQEVARFCEFSEIRYEVVK